MIATPEEVMAFWLDEIGPEGWYAGGEQLDETCRERFGDTWSELDEGGLSLWLTYPSGALAYIILADQLPRNMWRDTPDAFRLDPVAVAAAKSAIGKGWDERIDPPGRQFFYLPLMHAENLIDQDRCVRLFHERMPEAESNLLHAKAHREVIRKFGRFPHRNAVLGRTTTEAEEAFMADGGYGAIVREMQQTA